MGFHVPADTAPSTGYGLSGPPAMVLNKPAEWFVLIPASGRSEGTVQVDVESE
jgi:hypothetical protein